MGGSLETKTRSGNSLKTSFFFVALAAQKRFPSCHAPAQSMHHYILGGWPRELWRATADHSGGEPGSGERGLQTKGKGHAAEESPTLIRAWDLTGALSCPSAWLASHWLRGIPLAS